MVKYARTSFFVATLFAFSPLCSAAVQFAQVIGTTATQAVLSFDVPDPANCLVQISTDPTFTALVNDTNAALFPGSQQCNRSGAIVIGSHVTYTAGTRTSARGVDGRFYSLALEASRTHYYRIVSQSVDMVTGSFVTRNPPFGNTFPEPPPFDPLAPYNYAWPTIRPGLDRNVFFTDPLTGIQAAPVTGPGQGVADNYGTQRVQTAANGTDSYDAAVSGLWTNGGTNSGTAGCAVLGGGTNCVYSDPGQNPLLIRDAKWCIGHASPAAAGSAFACYSGAWGPSYGDSSMTTGIDDFQITFSASGTGGTTSLQFALTCSGVSPWTDWQTQNLTGSPVNYTFPANANFPAPQNGSGANKTTYGYWSATPMSLKFNGPDCMPHTGTVTVVNATGVVTWASGERFRVNALEVGSRITLGASDYRITAIASPNSVTIANPPADGTYNYYLWNYGVLIRKSAAVSGTLTINGAQFTDYESGFGQSPLAGPVEMCAATTVADGSGNTLRMCILFFGSSRYLYAINENTGASSYLGVANALTCSTGNCFSGVSGNHANDYRNNTDASFGGLNGVDPRHWYNTANTQTGNNQIIVDSFYNNAGAPGHLCPAGYQEITTQNCPSYPFNDNITQNNGTPAVDAQGNNRTMTAQMVAYNTAQRILHPEIPVFDLVKWPVINAGAAPVDIVKGWYCENATQQQDSMGWTACFDLNTSPTFNLVGMASSYGNPYPLRGGYVHGAGTTAGLYTLSTGYKIPENTGVGWGPMLLQVNTSTDATTQQVCSGIVHPDFTQFNGQTQCLDLTVAGSGYCHSNPNLGTETAPMYGTCPWRAGWTSFAGINVVVGELADDWNDSGEMFRVVKVNGNTITVLRHYATPSVVIGQDARSSTMQTHTAPWNFRMLAGMGSGNNGGLGWADFNTDPNGLQGSADYAVYISGHLDFWTTGVMFEPPHIKSIRISPSIKAGWNQPMTITLREEGPFNNFLGGQSGFIQTHSGVSRDAANPRYSMDKNPFSNVGSATNTLWNQAATLVGGSLWKITAANAQQGNPGGNWPQIVKSIPVIGWSAGYLLQDISGPASSITGNSGDKWKFCIAWSAGECFSGSAAGDVFVNVPASGHDGQCGPWDYLRNICVTPLNHSAGGVNQYWFPGDATISDGRAFRRLSNVFNRLNFESVFSSAHATNGGKWTFGHSDFYSNGRSDFFIIKQPPIPVLDSTQRFGFVNIAVTAGPGTGTATKARARFGYAENGSPAQFFCAYNRKEECRTTPNPSAANPYYFASEPGQALQDCAAGCTIRIPAIPGRVIYYRIDRLDAQGTLLQEGVMSAGIAP